MTTVDLVEAHAASIRGMGAIVDGVRPEQLGDATPCSEWNVRQLLRHVISGNDRWTAAAEGTPLDFSDELGPDVPDADLRSLFHESAERVDLAWRAPGVLERTFEGPQGPTPGAMRLSVHIGELVMHGWDLARATGQTPDFPVDIVEMFMGFAERMPRERPEGYPFASARQVDPSAPAIDRLAALMGRDV